MLEIFNHRWVRMLTSLVTTNILLAVYAVALGVATFIENKTDIAMARMLVYNGYWFYLLQILMIINLLGVVVRGAYIRQKKWGMVVFHGAFFLVLLGASVTHTFGFEGILHVREGEKQSRIISQNTYLNYSAICSTDSLKEQVLLSSNPLLGKGYKNSFRLDDKEVIIEQIGNLRGKSIDLQITVDGETRTVMLESVSYMVSPPTHLVMNDVNLKMSFGPQYLPLPFTVELTDFRLIRYPGSHSPSSYESDVIVTTSEGSIQELVSMNRVLHEQGYRIYQSSYDPDEKGSIFTVNNDAAGTTITYIGYILLGVGMLLILFSRNSRFAYLRRQLKEMSAASAIGLFIIIGATWTTPLSATPDKASRQQAINFVPDRAQADSFAMLQIQSPSGRLEPVGTHTRKLLRKLYRKDSYNGFTADQVILGILTYPQYWNMVKFIRQTNDELNSIIGCYGEDYVSFYDLFDTQGHYKLSNHVEQIYNKPVRERSRLEKDILKLDEKINIIYGLQQGRLLPIFPHKTDPHHKWYSAGDNLTVFADKDSMFVSKIMDWYTSELTEGNKSNNWQPASDVLGMIKTYQHARANIDLLSDKKVNLEIQYNKLSLFSRTAIPYMALGTFLLLFTVLQLIYRRSWLKYISLLLTALIAGIFFLLTYGIALRWYISGQAPWSNAYESMIHIGWAASLGGLIFWRRSPITLALASFLAGLILFVANLNFMDPEITPLVPVLKSPWLMVHVSSITASYGFFGMSFLLGLITLIMIACRRKSNSIWSRQLGELRIINELSLTVGLCLLTAGTFIGAIWANESWGRYWGWDPKETWALVTMIVYAFVLHARFIPTLRSEYAFSVMSVFSLSSVLMTFFGVNYYLSGMHSYGKSDTSPALGVVYLVFLVILLFVIWVGWLQKRIKKRVDDSKV